MIELDDHRTRAELLAERMARGSGHPQTELKPVADNSNLYEFSCFVCQRRWAGQQADADAFEHDHDPSELIRWYLDFYQGWPEQLAVLLEATADTLREKTAADTFTRIHKKLSEPDE